MVTSQVPPQHVWTPAKSRSYVMSLPPAAPYRFVRTWSEAAVQPWARAVVNQACQLEQIDDPLGYIATLHDVPGPLAFGETIEAARSELESVLIGWAPVKLDDGDKDIPVMGGTSLYQMGLKLVPVSTSDLDI